MRILLAQINPIVADLQGNTALILKGVSIAKEQRADIVLFPELALTGYPPDDFLLLPHFISAVPAYLAKIKEASKGITIIVGAPRLDTSEKGRFLYNSAAIYFDGQLVGFQDKSLLPTYDVFDERRYFEPSSTLKPWKLHGKKVAVTICEDLWQHSSGLLKDATYSRDPVLDLSHYKPDILLNLSSSPYSLGKIERRITVGSRAAKTLQCPVLLCNQVGGNDGLVFDGTSYAVDKDGELVSIAKSFEEDYLLVDLSGPLSKCTFREDPVVSLYEALVLGVKNYFQKIGFTKACLGISGGIDSAVVSAIAVAALGKENVLGISMPSRYSSKGSIEDALELSQNLGIHLKEIPIERPFNEFLNLLTPQFEDKPRDATEENIQARIRGIILMAISNKFGYIVLSTGNKSELAMGYSTLYGDMCGGLNVLSDVTKRQVYELARYINRKGEIIPKSSIQKAPSAELRENQKDSDTLPEYDIIDNVLKAYVEDHLSPEEIAKIYQYPISLVNDLVKKIHLNEYKRRQSPPGIRVSEKAFSVGRRFPIVQRWV